MIFAIVVILLLAICFGLLLIAINSKNIPNCYGSLHYDETSGELYLAISDETILDLADGEYVTLKFQRV